MTAVTIARLIAEAKEVWECGGVGESESVGVWECGSIHGDEEAEVVECGDAAVDDSDDQQSPEPRLGGGGEDIELRDEAGSRGDAGQGQ